MYLLPCSYLFTIFISSKLLKSQGPQHKGHSCPNICPPPPNGCVPHGDILELFFANTLEAKRAGITVMMKICNVRCGWECWATTTQAIKRQVVVNKENSVWVVEAFQIISKVVVLGTSVNNDYFYSYFKIHSLKIFLINGMYDGMCSVSSSSSTSSMSSMKKTFLKFQLALGNLSVWKYHFLMWSCWMYYLQTHFYQILHQLIPASMLRWNNHFINIQKSDKLESALNSYLAYKLSVYLYKFLYKQSL